MATDNDKAVLDAIFSPFGVTIDNISQEIIQDDELQPSEQQTQVQQAKTLEIEGVRAAENGDLTTAIDLFSQSITLVPTSASAYNNRAQAHQLNAAENDALNDLNEAIHLSHGRGRVASQAFCQRGLLHEKQGRREEALKDFQAACSLGSSFAKSALVHLNPYAALCNQMLTEMFTKIQGTNDIINN